MDLSKVACSPGWRNLGAELRARMRGLKSQEQAVKSLQIM